jgi:chemotaxis protein CheD
MAHLYGGANIVSGLGSIGSSNAAFARRFMETEGITVAHADLGGTSARKIEFLPHEGRSRCVKVTDRVPERPPVPVLAPDPGGDLELF